MVHEDYIDKYLLGEMNDHEIKQFESDLTRDRELKKMFNLTRDIKAAIAENEVLNLRHQLDSLHIELYSKPKTKVIAIRPLLKVASVVTGILMLSSVYLLLHGKMNNQDIYNKYYEPYESTVKVRSSVASQDPLSVAIGYYESGNFIKAASLFEQILAVNPDKMAANLYSGIAHMEIKEYEKANHSLKHIINSNDNPYIEQAEWYLGFCYLMTHENEKALEQFNTIAQSDSYYKNKARKIIRKIKRLEN